LGIGVGWVLGVCAMYFVTISNAKEVLPNLNNTVDIYIDNIDNIADVLYQNGVVQDKESFERFIKSKNVNSNLLVGQRITFSKAMTYEEIFEAVYKSHK
jgi:cell division protein YceG involved in septum cleavage